MSALPPEVAISEKSGKYKDLMGETSAERFKKQELCYVKKEKTRS
jgi:hypothetical protein